MRMFLISDDKDALTGFRLAGVTGAYADTREGTERLLEETAADNTVGIILITESLAVIAADALDGIKLSKELPLVVEIPGRNGSTRPENFIENYIKEAIGVKL